MVYDSDYRENTVTALDTATALSEQGADSPGAFDVPATASRITEIIIAGAPAFTSDAATAFSSAIRLSGAGVQLGDGYFPGPIGAFSGGAATHSAGLHLSPVQRYLTNIPVKGGGKINAHGYMHGADIGALHVLLQLVYDGPVVGRIVDMDYREQDLTAANTLVNLNTRAGATEGDFKLAYGKIAEIYFGAATVPTATTAGASTLLATALHLSGNALIEGGNYKFLGNSGSAGEDIADAADAVGMALTKYICDINTKIGNTLRAQAQMIEVDAGTAYAMCGLGYV